MKDGVNHINAQSVVPQQCPSLLSTKQRTKAGCCLAWAPPRWLMGLWNHLKPQKEVLMQHLWLAFLLFLTLWAWNRHPAPAPFSRRWMGKDMGWSNDHRFTDGFCTVGIKGVFLDVRLPAWKQGQNYDEVMKVGNPIFSAGGGFKLI